jgi:hypothetical protein
MNWLDLYKFLHEQANSINNHGKFDWQSPVVIHDANTGDEYFCDTYDISTADNNSKFVLAINIENIFSENSRGNNE